MQKKAKIICKRIATGISIFRKKIIEGNSFIYLPRLREHYWLICKYVRVSREMGYAELTGDIHIDFKQELSKIHKILGSCNKYTDLSNLDSMVKSILSSSNNAEAGDIIDDNVRYVIKEMIEAKVNSADKETAEALRVIAEQIHQ